VHLVDLEHDGLPGAIGVWVLEEPEPTLVDPGPSTSLERLEAGLDALGLPLGEVRHLLLTHVHLDHAGASGQLAARNPRLTVHVHEDGAVHMADPEKLVASTRRTFGDAHDRLWGEVLPVPADQIRGWAPGVSSPLPGIRPIPTPGHIAHHLAWEAERMGMLFAGDALGILLHPEAPTHPATPPPAVDLKAWRETLSETLDPVEVEAFGVTHFGLHADLEGRRKALLEALDALALRVDRAMREGPEAEEADREAFHEESIGKAAPHLPEGRARHYFETFPARGDWDGMRFHLDRTPAARPPR
jgi:glyoxylase-like metal-dependent hydrolase (beta-lactamase superfamily II)